MMWCAAAGAVLPITIAVGNTMPHLLLNQNMAGGRVKQAALHDVKRDGSRSRRSRIVFASDPREPEELQAAAEQLGSASRPDAIGAAHGKQEQIAPSPRK
ncbi:hypothetical protein EYF80_066371 [Liparis tanakae]|uniref:Uncharacterized protein n=1 Tax=Liparis tanakae TaxID=230148 RepID=A0A4Z2E420_9TELE|nr:hypothetical protein EYF80_066371 [Liparis tanakae]